MNDLDLLSPVRLSEKAKVFVSQASDLYVDFLSEGRKQLATSLLRSLVYAVGTLQKVSHLTPGHERSRELRHAASIFHKLALLIFASTMPEPMPESKMPARAVLRDEKERVDLRILDTYDAAADLSGLLIAASRRHPAVVAV